MPNSSRTDLGAPTPVRGRRLDGLREAISCFQLPELIGIETPLMTACHQPVETIIGNEVPAAWFANGLRVIDIANPLSMKQAAWWMPDVPAGAQRVCSNDVYVDHRGLIYLIDRNRGLSILERV
jgi:hypothetical protein